MAEQYKSVDFPARGIDDTTSKYDEQREGSAQVGVNVLGMDVLQHRLRGGSRPGLVRYIPARVNGVAFIQHLNLIASVSANALAGNFPDPEASLFYLGDPSIPSETGWAYTGDPSWPTSTFGEFASGDPAWITDPVTPVPARFGGFPILFGGSLLAPRVPGKLMPLFVWARPASILTGTALSGTQLNATAVHPVTGSSVAGVMAYYPPAGTVLAVGISLPLRAIFTPTDTSTYVAARGETRIAVTGSYVDSGLKWPNVLDVTFAFGTYSWKTTATYDTVSQRYLIDGLPHTLVDLNNGAANGKISLLGVIAGVGERPGFFVADTGNPSNIGLEITAPFGGGWLADDYRSFNVNVTAQNPYSCTATNLSAGAQNLTTYSGSTVSGTLTMAVTGVLVP